MKKSNIIICLLCVVIVINIIILLFFMPKSVETSTTINSTRQENKQQLIDNSLIPVKSNRNIEQNLPSQIENKNSQQTISNMQNFLQKLEGIFWGSGSREQKIYSLMQELNKANNDEEKIATLQTLADLKPIAQVDELIAFANSDKESEKVRAVAVNTLNETYLLDDKEIEQIGGAKISQYMAKLVNNPQTAKKIRNEALSNYAYTNEDKAKILVAQLIQKDKQLTVTEERLINTLMFANNENLADILPQLANNPSIISDEMAMQMVVFATDTADLNDITTDDKNDLIKILENHQFNPKSPTYQDDKEFLQIQLKELKQ